MSDYTTNFPPQTYSSSFYINAIAEGEKTTLMPNTDDEDEPNGEVHVKNSPILDCFISKMKTTVIIMLSLVFLNVAADDVSTATNHTAKTQSTTSKASTVATANPITPTQSITTQSSSNETQPSISNSECFEDKSGKVRTFKSLADYQGNRNSFNPRHPTYDGNIVEFNVQTIKQLTKNSFISFGSESVMKLDIHEKGIEDIEAGTFLGLTCLQELDLSRNNLSKLAEDIFEGLTNLKELNLSFNLLQNIPESGLAFVPLKNLKILNLSHNKIEVLNQLSFMSLNGLEILYLAQNKIRTIDPRVFNYLGALKQLDLSDNFLVDTSADQWKGLLNLTDLDLSYNYLASFDMTSNYSFVNLKHLNLSGNNLRYLNIYGIRRSLPNLFTLDLSNNSWYCEDFDSINHALKDSRITLPRPVSCSEVKTTSTKRVPVQTTTNKPAVAVVDPKPQHDYGPELIDQNSNILESNTKIIESIQDLRSVIVCLFIVFILCVVAEVGVRMGVCRSWYYSVMGRSNRGYLDAHDSESVGLISR